MKLFPVVMIPRHLAEHVSRVTINYDVYLAIHKEVFEHVSDVVRETLRKDT